MARWLNFAALCLATAPGAAFAQSTPAAGTTAQSPTGDPLVDGFREPPAEARPWVWWHWLNGNITSEGARLDLEWMKRAGIGGVQIFEGDLATPKLVANRLIYMSPEWKRAFREATTTATRLGLGVTIATSPGWSATGGPWVSPQSAMKKLVWSQLEVEGGRALMIPLPAPPDVAGPYQDVGIEAVEPGAKGGPRFYRDIATVAVRLPGEAPPVPVLVSTRIGPTDSTALRDGFTGPGMEVQLGADRQAWLLQDFGRPVTMRSVVVGLPAKRGFGAPPPAAARLEASDDAAAFRTVVELPPTQSPVRSAAFTPVTARYFRLMLSAPAVGGPPAIPGVMIPPIGGEAVTSYLVSEFAASSDPRVERVEEKAGYATVPDYYAVPNLPISSREAVSRSDVVDITRFLGSDGRLRWKAPPGRWHVLRMGYSLTGHQNGPAPVEATGLEVDKLSAAHVRDYAEHYLGMYGDAVGGRALAAAGVTSMLSDSIEAGPQNWTENMAEEFARRRGYSLLPWMPVLTGVVIGSAEDSDRFLWDFRTTISELLAENHYGVLADVAKAHGLSYYSEALEDHRPQLGDDLEMRRFATVPMGAMWLIPPGGKPNPTYVADLKGAASIAHLYGRQFVGSESLTAFGSPFGYSPRDLKSTVDLAFALGVTRPIIHTSAHQPFTSGHKPGLALATILGQYFTRNETWAEQARSWTDYLARTGFLLRQGRPYAEIAYFAGEEAPITSLYGDSPLPKLPAGHDFDFVNRDALFNRLTPVKGALVTPDGVRYEILVLGGSSGQMTLATLRRVKEFSEAGVAIVGDQPLRSPSLADDETAFAALASQLWNSPGAIFKTVDAALEARTLTPDWDAGGNNTDLAVLHRRLSDGDLYFLSNRSGRAINPQVRFRVSGKVPELWRADTAEIAPLTWRSDGERTTVSLTLAADDAVFVMFRKRSSASGETVAMPASHLLQTITGPWTISIGGTGQAPRQIRAAELKSWTTSSDPSIRYFSGTASYTRSLNIPAAWLDRNRVLTLDLGDVRELAEIWVNGERAGTLWRPPFRLDIGARLHAGANQLEVKVVNLWVNRLIGDAQPGAAPVTFTQAPTYTADAPLRQSGLLGPVTLWTRGN